MMDPTTILMPAKQSVKHAPQYGQGAGYKRRANSKRGKGSETPGSTKGERCQASYLQRHFARKSRAYKTIGYVEWCLKMNERNGRK